MKKVILFVLLFTCAVSLFAQRSKLRDLEKQRKMALLEIENTDRLLKDTKINTSSLLNRIRLISNQIETRQRVVRLLEEEVESIGIEEEHIAKEIGELGVELKLKRDSYEKAIISLMRSRQSDNKLLFVLSGRSLTESYRRFKYLKDYSDWRKRQAEEIIVHSQKLEIKQDSLKIAKEEKKLLLVNKSTEQEKLKEEENNYQHEIAKAQENQKDLQRILDQKRRQAEALDRQIEKLITQEVVRQEKKEQAKREKERKEQEKIASKDKKAEKKEEVLAEKTETEKSKDSEQPKEKTPTQPTATSKAENIKLSGSFTSNKGKLPYPISGNYSITSRFGPQKHGRWVTTSSSGIDIQSQANAQARAVFAGEVTTITAIPGYGSCVLIRHGNYYTFYGNIQNIGVKKGDKVTAGQFLGAVYTDPNTNISQIHFQLWQGKAGAAPEKLNPEPWLQ